MDMQAKVRRLAQVSEAFTPAAPVDDLTLFADRPGEVFSCLDALFQRGLHVAVYGERGAGKTSLANIVPKLIKAADRDLEAARVDCNTNDTFNSIWRKVFRALGLPTEELESATERGRTVDPEDIRLSLASLSRRTLIVIDELDRVEDDEALSLLADTVKTLSDHSTGATLMFVGVAGSVEQLLGEHESVVRSIRQIPLPRMTVVELEGLLEKGFAAIDDLEIEDGARARVVRATEGLPHFAHLLGLHAAQRAVQEDRSRVEVADVAWAESRVIQTHSMLSEYRRATQSPQPDHLFEEVLLACAYAVRDGLGYFRPSDVRYPLSRITGRDMQIPNFQRHLNELSGMVRLTLDKDGEPRRYHYRFRNPLFQPFVKMAGRANRRIIEELADELQERQMLAGASPVGDGDESSRLW